MRKHQVFASSKTGSRCLYIMNKSFRINNNYSLDEAIKYAHQFGLSLDIFIMIPEEDNKQAIAFFHEHTTDLKNKLQSFSKHVHWLHRDEVLKSIYEYTQAIFMDFSYLNEDIAFFHQIRAYAKTKQITLFQVESNVFVPVLEVSQKAEYGAYTIRPKIHKLLKQYDKQVLLLEKPMVGEMDAINTLKQFLTKLPFYHLRSDPSFAYTSRLSVYLKFGMISPVTIYHLLKPVSHPNKDIFLEELIVRRELAYNYVYYNPQYDKFERMTERWAYMTMHDHANDQRTYHYTMHDYCHFQTHDPYFNAAMKQMIYTGYMHGYMRMYWAKQIILWSKTYEEAYHTILTLNNHYFLDGFTPNSYAGVAWCLGKHDRAWKDRPIMGKLRYMNANGLKRKFQIDEYVKQMNEIEREGLR